MTNPSLSQPQESVQLEVLAKDTVIALMIKAIGLSLTYLHQKIKI